MIGNLCRSALAGALLVCSFLANAATVNHVGSNSPGASSDFTVAITSETSLRLTVPDDAGIGSYILLKKGSAPTGDDDYDFSSRIDDDTNQLYLAAPELSAGTWYARVLTPASESGTHNFTLTIDTDTDADAGGPYPVSRAFNTLDLAAGSLLAGESLWYRFEVDDAHDGWRLALHTTGSATMSLRLGSTSGITVWSSSGTQHTHHATPANISAGEVYYLNISANADTDITLSSDPVYARTLTWDPGTALLGSNILTQPDQVGGDYYFKILSEAPDYGAWRFALNVTGGEADLYLRQGSIPNLNATQRSETPGDDGYILNSNQFSVGQEWYIRVVGQPGSNWELYSGDIYVHEIGDCSVGGTACEVPAYSAVNGGQLEANKSVTVGPEGMAYFRAQVPVGTAAWRLFTRDNQHTLYVRKDSAPVSTSSSYYDRQEALQMLLVPSYLTSDLYYIGVEAPSDSTVFLDSRQQEIRSPGGDGFNFTLGGVTEDKLDAADSIGYGYITYAINVPADQIAWQVKATPLAGTADLYMREGAIPNVNENNGFSEAGGAIVDSITQVPPSLTDGTWYITVRGEGAFNVELDSRNPPIPSISFLNDGTPLIPHNGCENQAGWCYYVVDMDNQAQLDTLGWELALANQQPGTAIAIRDGGDGVPGKIQYRKDGNPGVYTQQYVDLIDDGGVLQDPGHQAAIWYVGIYNPGVALGSFELTTYEPVTTTVPFQSGASPAVVAGQEPDLWRFFRVDVPVGALGWDLRLTDVSGGAPRVVIERDSLPAFFGDTNNSFFHQDNWPSGWRLGFPSSDATGRDRDASGSTLERYQVFHAGIGSPLTAPGTYYIGVKGVSETGAALNYTLESRGIGEGASWSVPVDTLGFGAAANGTGLAPREVAYYKVTVPANTTSMQVKLDVQGPGEALMLVRQGKLPNVYAQTYRDSDQVNYNNGTRRTKPGNEYLYKYQPSNGDYITAGDYFIAVVSEGQSPANGSTIGTGAVDYTLSVGEMPVEQMGPSPVALTAANDEGNPLTWNGQTLDYGEQKAYRFRVSESLSALEVRLLNTSGNPYVALREATAGSPRFPRISDSYEAEEGGDSPDFQGYGVQTITEPNGDITVVVSANTDGGVQVAAGYDLHVVAFGETILDHDGGTATVVDQSPDTWRYFRVDVPADALGWDVRLNNVTSGEPRMVIQRDGLPPFTNNTSSSLYYADNWPSGARLVAPTSDSTGRTLDATGTVYERYRVFHAGVTSPLTAPGTYYVGVKGASDTGDDLAYTIESRGIGEGAGWSLPVSSLAYGGSANGTGLAPREVAYYKVTVPVNSRSLQVELEIQGAGEALMLVRHGKLPNIFADTFRDSDQANYNQGTRKITVGNEYLYKYQPSNGDYITAGDYYIAVVSEGQSPASSGRIGTGGVDYTLSAGAVPVDQKGATPVVLTAANDEGNPLSWDNQTLAYGQQKAYRFQVNESLSFLEVRLVSTTGVPYAGVLQSSIGANRFPRISDDADADEGGDTPLGQGPGVVTVTEPNGDITVVVSANRDGVEASASYDLQVVAFGEVSLDFDGGSAAISNQAPDTWRYFRVDVPAGALGWDVRLNNVTSGEPRMVIQRDGLPPFTNNTSSSLYYADNWPSGARLVAPTSDSTGRTLDATGTVYERYRVFHAGVTSPLTAPGTYYVGVKGASDTGDDLAYTIESRGIGEGAGWSLPVSSLAYGGSVNGTGLAPREVAYYKVTVPANSRSLLVDLDVQGAGEALMLVRHGKLPNVFADTFRDSDQANYNQGTKKTKTGDEYLYKYESSSGDYITAGDYYIAVVSEGQSPASSGRIGAGGVDYTLSAGAVPLDQKGATPVILTSGNDEINPLRWNNQSLAYGELKSFRYLPDSDLQAVEVRLVNTTGAPYLALADDPGGNGKFPRINDSADVDEGGISPLGQSGYVVTQVDPKGMHTVTVAANLLSGVEVSASFDLVVVAKDVEADLAFDGGSASSQLLNEQMHFYRVEVPASGLNSGWQLSLTTTGGTLAGWVQKDSLPTPGQGIALASARRDTVITSPSLSAGTWYIALKSTGITDYTIASKQVAPEVNLAYSGASSGEVDLESGRWHFYTVNVPDGNTGALRTLLEAVSGDPELYIREQLPPTIDHRSNGQNSGSNLYDRYDTGNGDRYGNWVPREDVSQLDVGTYWLGVYANGSNVRYQMHVNSGNITDLPVPTYAVSGQTLAAGDMAYYRFVMPDISGGGSLEIIDSLTVSLLQNQGDVVVYIRDEIPPGQGAYLTDWRDWYDDNRYVSPNPYISIDDTGDNEIDVTALIPGATYYLGVYARNDANFDLQVSLSSGTVALDAILDFQAGSVSTTIAAGEEKLYLVDVPSDGTRWKHTSTHDSGVQVFARERSLPFGTTYDDWYSSGADSAINCYMRDCANGRWEAGQRVFLRVVNSTGADQPFTLQMNGQLISTDDEDADGLLDWWEWQYFGGLYRRPNQDSDGDGVLNGDEYNEGTDPTDRFPTVTIDSPADASVFTDADSIVLTGTATDYEDGDISVNISWESDLDGWLGNGDSLPVTLTAGNQVITATVIDSAGAEPRTLPMISLQVDAATDVPGDVNGDGEIGLGDLWLLQRYVMGMESLDSEAQLRADIAPEGSPDGVVDLGDQLLLMRWLLNP